MEGCRCAVVADGLRVGELVSEQVGGGGEGEGEEQEVGGRKHHLHCVG